MIDAMTEDRDHQTMVDEVRNYYERNTPEFERFGQGRRTGTIHRAVWGSGVASREAAFHYVEQLILSEIEALGPRFGPSLDVLDLGCGVGASLIFLCSRTAMRGAGVTLSGLQARLATERIQDAGLEARVQCHEGNFLNLPATIGPAHLAFSIEAFIHGPDPAAYFSSAARHVRPGGLLIVCDDFLTERGDGSLSATEMRCLDELRRGWAAHTLVTTTQAGALATSAGFEPVRNVDLTAQLELGRARDVLLSALVAVGRHLPITGYRWRSLMGGSALQTALTAGLVQYRFVVWRRTSS